MRCQHARARSHITPARSRELRRLYMVKSIKGVKEAAVSKGMGRFDFLDDIQSLRPDIYFVNDDASKLDERMKVSVTRL